MKDDPTNPVDVRLEPLPIGREETTLSAGPPSEPLEFEYFKPEIAEEKWAFEVQVVNSNGAALASIEVAVSDGKRFQYGRTSKNGLARFNITNPTYVLAGVRIDGPRRYMPAHLDVPDASRSVTIRLLEAQHINGVVKDEFGNPAAGIEVRALVGGSHSGTWRTNSDGKFDYTVTGEGLSSLLIPLQEVCRKSESGLNTVFVEGEYAYNFITTEDIELRVVPARGKCSLKARILAPEMLDKRVVYIRGIGTHFTSPWTNASPDGFVQLDGFFDEPIELDVTTPADPGWAFSRSFDRQVESDAGEIVIPLERGLLVSGRVLDQHGHPISGVDVVAREDGPRARHVTDKDGSFQLALPKDCVAVEIHFSRITEEGNSGRILEVWAPANLGSITLTSTR